MAPPDIVLCDLDGVVWLGGRAIPGSVDAVRRLRRAGCRVVFVTNSSAPTIAEHEASLAAIGLESPGDVVSSATAAAALIQRGERVLVCGGAGVAEAVATAGATAIAGDDEVGASAGVDAVVVGLHRQFDYHRLTVATAAVRAGARFIATNRDPLFPTAAGPLPGGGTIVAAVATATGREPETAGKPHPPMIAAIVRHVGGDVHGGRDDAFRRRLLVIGDQVSTDGRFAEALGASFALVRTGNTAPWEQVAFETAFDGADLATVTDAIVAGRE